MVHANDDKPLSMGINGIPFGIDCTHLLVYNPGAYINIDSKKSWYFYWGSPFYLINNNILSGLQINDYNKLEFMYAPLATGIIKFTDTNNNIRTFQCCGIYTQYATSYHGDGYRYCPVFRAYRKGPQAQWSTNFNNTSGYYDCDIEIIDNDGNPIDYENGFLIQAHNEAFLPD